jgi:CPA2 family monovalent cation:H+ antiporter-2
MPGNLVYDLLVVLTAGLIAGLICRRLHVSVLVGYLVAGAIIGEGCLGWVGANNHELESFAEVGVFLLLFAIGLEFSLDELWRLGRHLVTGGSVQMLLVSLPVATGLRMLDFSWSAAVLIASATAFSSTVLVFKTLTEWGQSTRPHGRRAIGILLFQDAALIPLLMLAPLLAGEQTSGGWGLLLLLAISTGFIVSVVLVRHLLAHWVIPFFASYRSPELVVLFTLVVLGGVTLAAFKAGLPPAIGAFAAGLIFSGNRWTTQIDALVLPFRESFAAVFFIGLGLLFHPALVWQQPVVVGGGLVALILIKGVAAAIALRLTNLSWLRSVGMGLGLAHIGEFAFVLVQLGVHEGVLGEQDYQRFIAIALGSLVLSPLIMKTGLSWTKDTLVEEPLVPAHSPLAASGKLAIVIGAGPIGRRVASQLETIGKELFLIDFSPMNLHPFALQGFHTIAGDATDMATLKLAHVESAALVVVCLSHDTTALRVVRLVRAANPNAFVAVRCRYLSNEAEIQKAGADAIVSEESQSAAALLRILTSIHTTS